MVYRRSVGLCPVCSPAAGRCENHHSAVWIVWFWANGSRDHFSHIRLKTLLKVNRQFSFKTLLKSSAKVFFAICNFQSYEVRDSIVSYKFACHLCLLSVIAMPLFPAFLDLASVLSEIKFIVKAKHFLKKLVFSLYTLSSLGNLHS